MRNRTELEKRAALVAVAMAAGMFLVAPPNLRVSLSTHTANAIGGQGIRMDRTGPAQALWLAGGGPPIVVDSRPAPRPRPQQHG
jgi:hypothetical protein